MFDNDNHEYANKDHYKYITCHTKSRPNALDFMLVTQLGHTLRQFGKQTKYYIVTNDKGYNAVIEYWKERGYDIYRLGIKFTTQEQTRISASTMRRCKKAFNTINKNCSQYSLRKKTHNILKSIRGVDNTNIDEICGRLLERTVK